MPFSSFAFLALLPAFLVAYWVLPRGLQRWVLLAASTVVYLYAGWRDLALLVLATWTNWASHRWLPARSASRAAMVGANLAVLGWFKYRAFLGAALGLAGPGSLLIPLGISFYVFQLIAYQVEVWRGLITEVPDFLSFFLYIFFFPHHQAGPIMRPHRFIGAFQRPKTWSGFRFKEGLVLILWGLGKKIWIADTAAKLVDSGFITLHRSQGRQGNLPLLAIAYGIQIYGDFSGYSDMAVGLGKIFGFKLDRNFHQPYLAKDPSDFWRRWHVTLSQWLRDFLYIPLGGNRLGEGRTLLNLLLVMLIGGLWHGAAWSFILWGGIHGLLLVGQRVLKVPARFPKTAGFLIFQLAVMLAWLPFRESDLGLLGHAAARPGAWIGFPLVLALALFAVILAFSTGEAALERAFPRLATWLHRRPLPAFSFLYGAALYLVMVGSTHVQTFIYQRF